MSWFNTWKNKFFETLFKSYSISSLESYRIIYSALYGNILNYVTKKEDF